MLCEVEAGFIDRRGGLGKLLMLGGAKWRRAQQRAHGDLCKMICHMGYAVNSLSCAVVEKQVKMLDFACAAQRIHVTSKAAYVCCATAAGLVLADKLVRKTYT